MEIVKFLLHLPQLVRHVIDLAHGTRDLARSSDISLAGLSDDEIDYLRSCMRSLLRTCAATVLVFGVVLPLGWPWCVWKLRNLTLAAAQDRALASLAFMVVVLFPLSLFLGASLGCLIAPSEFLQSPLGRKWLKFTGAKSVAGARFVSFLAAMSLTVCFFGYCWYIYEDHQHIEQNKPHPA